MLWTMWHVYTFIPCMILYIVLAIFIGKWLKNKSENIRLIPIHIISGIIVILEIIKQVRSISIGYDLKNLPLHYCSLFLYLFPLASFCKGKFKKYARFLTVLSGIVVILVMCVMPRVIYNQYAIIDFFNDFGCFHTVFYHNIVFLGTCLILSLNLVDVNIKNKYWVSAGVYFSYCIVGICFALGLNVNYNQFCCSYVSGIENLRLLQIEKLGYWGQIIYIAEVTFSTVCFSMLICFSNQQYSFL